jgi:hypothetical protein
MMVLTKIRFLQHSYLYDICLHHTSFLPYHHATEALSMLFHFCMISTVQGVLPECLYPNSSIGASYDDCIRVFYFRSRYLLFQAYVGHSVI